MSIIPFITGNNYKKDMHKAWQQRNNRAIAIDDAVYPPIPLLLFFKLSKVKNGKLTVSKRYTLNNEKTLREYVLFSDTPSIFAFDTFTVGITYRQR